MSVAPPTTQRCMQVAELDTIARVQASVRYDGFNADSSTVKLLWEVVRELPEADGPKLLAFITGARLLVDLPD